MANFQAVEERKAKGTYRCALCGEIIYRGDRHTYVYGLSFGIWYAERYHRECFAVAERCRDAGEATRSDSSGVSSNVIPWVMRTICDKYCPEGRCTHCESGCTRCPNVLDELGIDWE